MKPEDIAGPAAVKALQDAGYTLVPPKEPARLVTMEESGKRYEFALALEPTQAWRPWGFIGALQESRNAADDWLVKMVNRRIIDSVGRTYAGANFVMISDLRRLFCGEGA